MNLHAINTPEELEKLIVTIPNVPVLKTIAGKTYNVLDIKMIGLIKKEIFSYIIQWRDDLTKYDSAYLLLRDLFDDIVYLQEQDEKYIASVKSNLNSIERHISNRRDGLPTARQKTAMENLRKAKKDFETDKKIGQQIAKSLYDIPNAGDRLEVFMTHYLGTDISPERNYL